MHRTRPALILAVLAALALAAPASASMIVARDGRDATHHGRLTADGHMPTPRGTIVVDYTGCPYGDNATACASGRGLIYLAPGSTDAIVWRHELGHTLDAAIAEDAGEDFRDAFADALGAPRDWYGGKLGQGTVEHFADAYAVCATYGPRLELGAPVEADGTIRLPYYGLRVTPDRLVAACAVIRDAAARAGADAGAPLPAAAPTPAPIAQPRAKRARPTSARGRRLCPALVRRGACRWRVTRAGRITRR
jgi:hypothetical protein